MSSGKWKPQKGGGIGRTGIPMEGRWRARLEVGRLLGPVELVWEGRH